MSTKKILVITLTFIAFLTAFRLLWLHYYSFPDHPQAVQGELDLRHWEPIKENSVSLDGEWEFFANTFLMQGEVSTTESYPHSKADIMQVPGSWSHAKLSNESSTYGFGSYRLRILVDPDKGKQFGIRIPRIVSSSEVYINGRLLAASGQPAEAKPQYLPLDKPYTVYFTLEQGSEIELVIQVANYDHTRDGGIVRSLKFGLADPLRGEIQFAAIIIILACVVYLFHALYGFILYLVGSRDYRLLYFSLMIICIVLGTLVGERLLFEWFPFNYEWSVKSIYLIAIAGGYCLMQCLKGKLPERLRSRLILPYSILCGGSALVVLLLPASIHITLTALYIFVMLIPCLLAPLVMYQVTAKIDKDNILLLLAIIAAIGSLIWFIIIIALDIEMISYPFDLLIATICFCTYWFKQYFRIHQESQLLTSKLQEADKKKDDFLVTVAHEMRNPIHGIMNISQAVVRREKGSLADKSVKDLELLTTVSHRMSMLLNDLLDLARLKENRIVIQPKDVSVHNTANAVMDMLRYMTEGKPVQLINRIPNSFPLVIADENRLSQILFNLLHNAIKYTEAGEVSIQADIEGNWARISISDTGIGMEQEFMDKIFEPYEQASQHITSDAGGFGLGLSICKRLVEMHGGTLEVKTKLNEGSVFTFNLKLSGSAMVSQEASLLPDGAPGQIAAAQDSIPLGTMGNQTMPAEPIHILAVDDDPINLKVLESMFSASPYEIVTVTSGKEALAMLETGEWDLVIADVMMPNMSGYELTDRIRERFSISQLPVLLLTACNRDEDIEAGFRAGANDYVTKPMNAAELRSRVQSLTELKKSVSDRLRMEAAWLQAQIKPHFMINAFTAITELSRIDMERMDSLVNELANYMRLSIDFQNSDEVAPLEHELQLVRSYLMIQKERFDDRLGIVWEVDAPVQLNIPPLTIQPLVENAIIHGILKRSEGGEVRLRITDAVEYVEVVVADNGIGMEEEVLKHLLDRRSNQPTGIGLLNTDRRLKQFYGAGLRIESKLNEGTVVSFRIPLLER